MDVFDLQASVKIDTTEASKKLDDLIAKAKELDQYLNKPHGININNGNSGSNPVNYGNNGGNGFFLVPPASGASGSAGNLNGSSPFLLNPGSSAGNNVPTVTANNGTTVQMSGAPYVGIESLGGVGVPLGDTVEFARSHIYSIPEETANELKAMGSAYKDARRNGYKGSEMDWANGDYSLWSSLPHYSQKSKTSELERGFNGSLIRKRNYAEVGSAAEEISEEIGGVPVDIEPEVAENANQSIADQIGSIFVDVVPKVAGDVAGEIFKSGANKLGDWLIDMLPGHESGLSYVPTDNYLALLHRGEEVLTADEAREHRESKDGSLVAKAIDGLRHDMQNMSIRIGEKEFGRATVNHGGNRIKEYIGSSSRSEASGYGWQ